jgi:hypothetical protein
MNRWSNLKTDVNYWPIGTKHAHFVADAWRIRHANFQEGPFNEREKQPKRHTALQVMCPQLLTDRNQTSAAYSARLESAKYDISGKPVQCKSRYSGQGNSAQLSTDRNETCTFVGHVWRIRCMNFHENPSNRSRETGCEAEYSSRKVSLITDRSQINLHSLQRMRRECEVWISLKNPSNVNEIQRTRNTALQAKVPLSTDRSEPHFHSE